MTETTVSEVTALARRLANLEDKFAILEITAEYNEAWDDGRLTDWVDTWTSDATFALPGAPDTVGSAALLRMVETMQEVGFVHMAVNPRIWIEGDRARQHCYALLGVRSPSRAFGSSQWLTTGRYLDELVRTPAGWRFARRHFAADAAMGDIPRWW